MEWVRTCPSTPSTSTLSDLNDAVDRLSRSPSALVQLDRRDPDARPRRTEVSLLTVRSCCCGCSGLRRRDSSRDIFASRPGRSAPPHLRRRQQDAVLLCDDGRVSAARTPNARDGRCRPVAASRRIRNTARCACWVLLRGGRGVSECPTPGIAKLD